MSRDSIRVVLGNGTNAKTGRHNSIVKNKFSGQWIVSPTWFRGWLFIFPTKKHIAVEVRELGQVRLFLAVNTHTILSARAYTTVYCTCKHIFPICGGGLKKRYNASAYRPFLALCRFSFHLVLFWHSTSTNQTAEVNPGTIRQWHIFFF
jgi:hypothetical protein